MILLMLYNTIIFMNLKHPISCGISLLMETIFICLMTGPLMYNFFYSYILFLIMIGGLLILFIYMTSIASNEKFKINMKILLFLLITAVLIIMTKYDNFYWINNWNLMEMQIKNFNQSFLMNKYMNYPNFIILIKMFIYLFITLIATVKISIISKGTLRQKF